MTLLISTIPLVGRVFGRQPFLVAATRNLSSSSTRQSLAAATVLLSSSRTFASLANSSMLPSSNASSIDRFGQVPTFFTTRNFTAAPTIQQKPEIKLYQYHICPFCNITKSLLLYSNLDYDSIEVNPLTKAELKPWSGDYKKVPIALIDEKQVNGSDGIIDSILRSSRVNEMLEKRWEALANNSDEHDNVMTMQQFQKSDNAQKWTAFARDDLAALLYPNICGSLGDSYDAFGYVKDVDSFSAFQKISIQSLGALAMYFAASKVKSKRNITDEKAALREALEKFEKEGLQNGKLPYSSGLPCPDMGDLAMFGVLYSVRGLAAHDDAILLRGGPLQEWYNRMHGQVHGKEAK